MAETMMPEVKFGAENPLFSLKTTNRKTITEYDKALKIEISNKWKRTRTAWLLLAPSLVFLTIFTIYPIIKSIINSFYLDNLSVMQPVLDRKSVV